MQGRMSQARRECSWAEDKGRLHSHRRDCWGIALLLRRSRIRSRLRRGVGCLQDSADVWESQRDQIPFQFCGGNIELSSLDPESPLVEQLLVTVSRRRAISQTGHGHSGNDLRNNAHVVGCFTCGRERERERGRKKIRS